MSIFVKPTIAPAPRTGESAKISLLYAGILIVMALTQLFTFEEFLLHFEALQLPGAISPYVLASTIVASEVFALPFLLRMSLSPAFRYFSMFLGWFAAALWLFISVWIVTERIQVMTVGFFGTLVDLPPGWWAVCISVALIILATWASWGLWPGKRRSTI